MVVTPRQIVHHCFFCGWWFYGCYASNLNGKYYSGSKMSFNIHSKNIPVHSVIHWKSNGFNGGSDSLIFAEMKVRRKL